MMFRKLVNRDVVIRFFAIGDEVDYVQTEDVYTNYYFFRWKVYSVVDISKGFKFKNSG